LTALLRQTLSPDLYEIIISDDAALESTRAQVMQWTARSRVAIRYVAVQGSHGPAAARNQGWRKARADIIAFTDDDTVPDLSWLEQGLAGMQGSKIAAASGRVVMPLPDVPTDYEKNESGLCSAEFVTANCFVRKQALEGVGGFDERFKMAWREDSDLHFSLLRWCEKNGLQLARLCDAIVVHPVRPGRWGISLSQQKKSQFNALLYKKHPKLYRKRIQTLPPIRYYVITACLALALIGGATRLYALALVSVWMWLMLTASFAIRRLTGTSWKPSHVAEMIYTSALIPPLSIYWRLRGALKFGVLFL
jgi:glycosyltransferase involved in cell wall biosynthesis